MSVEQRRDGGLHRPWHDHDGCGIGFVADASGQPSHRVLRLGLGALARLSHRGAVSADRLTGDGAGVLVQLPRSLFRQELDASGVRAEDLAVGSLFLWADDAESRAEAIATVEATIATTGLGCLGWRPVPVDEEALGELASARRPEILHLLVGRPAGGGDGTWFERRLYLLRRRIEKAVAAIEGVRLSIASLSHRTLATRG